MTPVEKVFAALEAAGCVPRGPAHKFQSKCPCHEDRSPSLSVTEGSDQRVLLYCFAGCRADAIVHSLGLVWSDLFAPGSRHGRRTPGLAKPRAFVDVTLQALREMGLPYRACASPSRWVGVCPIDIELLWIEEREGAVSMTCVGGCEQRAIIEALAGVTS